MLTDSVSTEARFLVQTQQSFCCNLTWWEKSLGSSLASSSQGINPIHEGKSFSGSKPLHSLKVQSEGVGVLLLRFWDPSCRDSGRPRFVDSAIGVV